MERAPVSLERLTLTDLGMVAYAPVSSGDSATEPVIETGLEFLARLVPHVLHRYEWRLHTYGAISTTHRQRSPTPSTKVPVPGSQKGGRVSPMTWTRPLADAPGGGDSVFPQE